MPDFTLASLMPLLGIMAAERSAGDSHLHDELRQEGIIAAWRVMQERPEASRAYVTTAARRAMGDVLRGRPRFGATSQRGHVEAHRSAVPYTFTAEDDDAFASVLADVQAAQALARVERADIEAEIAREVDELGRDGEIVRLRFWSGLEWSEIAARTGMPRATVARRWSSHARVTLAQRLAHLQDAA